eukprot:346630-Chlamydomonas_euryale.AAC.1
MEPEFVCCTVLSCVVLVRGVMRTFRYMMTRAAASPEKRCFYNTCRRYIPVREDLIIDITGGRLTLESTVGPFNFAITVSVPSNQRDSCACQADNYAAPSADLNTPSRRKPIVELLFRLASAGWPQPSSTLG